MSEIQTEKSRKPSVKDHRPGNYIQIETGIYRYKVPGKLEGKPAHRSALQHALRRLRKRIGRKVTSHGMRAFYVLVRRSWGIEDGVIAIELGQGSGSGLISATYGDIPQNWRNGGGPQLTWLSATPAWADLEKDGWNACTPTIEHINEE